MNIKQLNEELQRFLETQDAISFGFINEDTGILYGEPELFDKFEDIMDVVTLRIEPNKSMLLSVNDEGFGTYSRISGTTLQEIEANWVKQWKEDPELIYDCFDEDTGLIMETDEEFDTEEEFIEHAERYYTESYIDGDSGSAIVIFNPFTKQVLIGGDIEVQPIEDVLDELEADFEEEDYDESFKTKKSHKRKLKETNGGKVKTFNFKIEHSKNEDDIYNITEDCGYEFELQCDGDLRKEIEDFVRNEFCFEFYNYVNITPEIIGYKYDNVTGEGFFTLNVVFGVNESYKRKSLKRKLKESEQNNDKQQLIALARKYGDNITLKDILAKLREVNEKLSDQANKSTNKFIKRVEKVDKKKKEK